MIQGDNKLTLAEGRTEGQGHPGRALWLQGSAPNALLLQMRQLRAQMKT